MMSHLQALLLIHLFSIPSVLCQRTPTHLVTAMCLRDASHNTMTMTLNIDIQNDPPGRVRTLDSSNVEVCTISTSNVPDLVSVIRTDIVADVSDGCGVTRSTNDQGVATYIWRVHYREVPDGRIDIGAGINRIYSIQCTANSPLNEVEADIVVSTPNLDQVIQPIEPQTKLEVLYASNGAVIGNTAVLVDTECVLRLSSDFTGLPTPRPVAVAGIKTVAASTPAFNAASNYYQTMIGANGCKMDNAFSPEDNFKPLAMSTVDISYQQTGKFNIWKFDDDSDTVYIKTYYKFCLNSDNPTCGNPCTSAVRRKRADTDEEEREIVVAVRVYDPSKEKEKNSGLYEDVLIGVSVAGSMILVILIVATCYIVIRMRRSRREERKSGPPAGFENKLHIPY